MNRLPEELRELLDRADRLPASERRDLAVLLRGWANAQSEGEVEPEDGFPGRFGMIGHSKAMEQVFALLARVLHTDVPILVTGETGTGKELVASALHQNGPRRKGPFVAVNCAAIPATLLEAELFGHVRGSFTGAHKDRQGYVEVADGGTLFLDEIGEMPVAMQAKLLRFLQEGEVRPVGGNAVKHVDVRVVAATNRALEQQIKAGAFREDLYYRLAVLTLSLPALRERAEDIELLAKFLLSRNEGQGLPTAKLSDDAIAALAASSWPGNIRQLHNELTRAAAFANDGLIKAADLELA
ncbi:MAG: sigma-54 dependent transcriptional regulator [Planctomycetes bacterium]|nr:sigma-54 dependent transcriptional regulator [Planctomycetota bacterium]